MATLREALRETDPSPEAVRKLQYQLNVLHENLEIMQAMLGSLEHRLQFVTAPTRSEKGIGKPNEVISSNSDACISVMTAIDKVTYLQSQVDDILNRLDV